MIRPATIAALVVAVLGGLLIGKVAELETVLLAGLGCLIGLVMGYRGAPPHEQRTRLWTGVACLVIGGGGGLVVARIPDEQTVVSAARSVALNPVILAGFAVGARLSWFCLRWAAQPGLAGGAPSAASHPAQPPVRTPVAGSR